MLAVVVGSLLSTYPRVYGALGGFIILMLWIYIASLIMLIGADTERAIEHPAAEARDGRKHVEIVPARHEKCGCGLASSHGFVPSALLVFR